MNLYIAPWVVIVAVTLLLAILSAAIKFGIWKGTVDTDRDNFKDFIADIKSKMDRIYDHLIGSPSKVTDTNSPLTLNKLGKEIAEEIEADEIVINIWQSSNIIQTETNSPYDIQEFCFKYADDLLLRDENIRLEQRQAWDMRIKDAAFNNGLTVPEILKVIGIVLRDKVLREKGISLPD